MSKLPLVSVVITTKNEERNIGYCLQAVRKQKYENVEVIVVDNYSSDSTPEISRSFDVRFFCAGPERSAQRNLGLLKEARGEYALFLDADMIIAPDTIVRCVQEFTSALNQENLVGLYIPEHILGTTLLSKIRRFERPYYTGTPIDCSRFFLLRAFKEIGGFDEETFSIGSGEDWDLDRRLRELGLIKVVNPEYASTSRFRHVKNQLDAIRFSGAGAVIFHNESDLTLNQIIKKKKYYAKGFDGYVKKWGFSDPIVRYQLSPTNRLFYIFFRRNVLFMTLRNMPLYMCFFIMKSVIGLCVFRRLNTLND